MASLLCEDVVTPDDSQQGIIKSGSSTNLGSDIRVSRDYQNNKCQQN